MQDVNSCLMRKTCVQGAPDSQLAYNACKKQACAIQTCLKRNNYQVERCQTVVAKLRECCRGYEELSVHCRLGPTKQD